MIVIGNTEIPLWGLVAAALLSSILTSCPDNNDSITDCSHRNQPQHYDRQRGRWNCDDNK